MELWLPNKEDISLPPKPARFVFATGGRTGHAHNPAVPLRSKQSKIPSSTADLMRTSGLRVVHALSKGRQGKEGDLEKSRSQLERDGFISKRNYDEESEYKSARVRRKQGSTLDIGERVEVKVDKGFVAGTIEKRTENHFEVEFRGGEDGERNTRDTESLSRKVAPKLALTRRSKPTKK